MIGVGCGCECSRVGVGRGVKVVIGRGRERRECGLLSGEREVNGRSDAGFCEFKTLILLNEWSVHLSASLHHSKPHVRLSFTSFRMEKKKITMLSCFHAFMLSCYVTCYRAEIDI